MAERPATSNGIGQAGNSCVIGASLLLPMSGAPGEATVLHDYGLRMAGGIIEEVAPYETLLAGAAREGLSAEFLEGHMLLPGLVNCHGHAAMSLLRGYADDQPLQTWLEEFIWPAEAALVDENFVRDGVTLAIAEMLQSGTTTFSDMYFFPDVTASVAESVGMRAQVNFPVIEFPSRWAATVEEYIEKGLALFDSAKHSELIEVGFAPHAPYTVSDESFGRVAVLAAEVDAHIQVHLHETAREVAQSLKEHGASPVQRLQRLDILGPRTQAVHMTCFSAHDLELLQDSDSSVVHCPASNAKLGSGRCNVRQLLEAGLRVGLGTDSAASNNSLDLFDTARLAALLAKQDGDASALPAWQALYLATQGGANALGLGERIGSLETGKQADVIAIDTRTAAMQPLYNAASQLVYTAAGRSLSDTWVAGRRLVRNGQLQSIDADDLVQRASEWRDKASQL